MYKLLTGVFARLSLANFAALVKGIYNSLITGPGFTAFPEPWPDPYPKRTDLTDVYTAFTAAQDAMDGTKIARDRLKAARQALTAVLKKQAKYFEAMAEEAGDIAMLDATGIPRRQPIVRSSGINGTLPAPVFTAKQGTLAGTFVGRVVRMDGAGSYEGQAGLGDPTVEANYKTVVISTRATHIVFPEMIRGQLYSLRTRAIGRKGPGAWSEPVILTAI